MPHKACDHDEWAKKKQDFYNRKRKPSANVTISSGKLSLSGGMRQALMTEGNMTKEQAQVCWTQMQAEN